MNKILIVDDEVIIRDLLKELIENFYDISVDVAEEGNQALEMSQQNDYSLILTDINMPNGMNGDVLVNKVIEAGFNNKICVMSGYCENEFLDIHDKIDCFFKKPLKTNEMFAKLKDLI